MLSRTNQNVVCLFCDSLPIEDKDLLGELTKAKVILQKSKLFHFTTWYHFYIYLPSPKNYTHLYFMHYRWYMSKLSGYSNFKQYNILYFKLKHHLHRSLLIFSVFNEFSFCFIDLYGTLKTFKYFISSNFWYSLI